MLGPVVSQEMLLGGRRYRLHLFRWVYAGWLVLTVLTMYLQYLSEEANIASARLGPQRLSAALASAPEVIGARFASLFIWQQTILLLLSVPLFTAGAILDEKRQGTLQYLLLSDLEPRHLLVGKLIGRVTQVVLLMLAGLPLFALFAGFGGVEPLTLLVVLGAWIGPIYGIAAISLLASVGCRQTRDAVVAVYAILVVGWVGSLFLKPLQAFNPLWVIEPAWGAVGSLNFPEALHRLAIFTILWIVTGTISLAFAARQLLPSYRRELENQGRNLLRWFSVEREPIDDNPIRWREQFVEGLAINATFRRIPVWVAILAISSVTAVSSLLMLYYSLGAHGSIEDVLQALLHLNVRRITALLPDASDGFLIQGIVVMLLASLVVGVRCAGALTQERDRHTWEAILLTPLSARQIVHGKLWGICLASGWYLLAYAAPSLTFSVLGGPLALGYTLIWLSATFLAIYFIGAAGLWCSARASSSWSSLLQTMGFGYLGGLLIFVVCSPAIFVVLGILIFLTGLLDLVLGTRFAWLCLSNFTYATRVFFLASATSLVLIFWFLAGIFLRRAQRWIADRERTRYHSEEPLYRHTRRDPLQSRRSW